MKFIKSNLIKALRDKVNKSRKILECFPELDFFNLRNDRDPSYDLLLNWDINRGVAQLVARIVRGDEVAGSSPVTPTIGSFLVIPEHLSELPAPQYQ